MGEWLEYLKPHEVSFLKSLGESKSTSSYRDWVNQENKLNEIYRFILSGKMTFRHNSLHQEGFVSRYTLDPSQYQFTIFDRSLLPIGHFLSSTVEELSRQILDRCFSPTRDPDILF